MTQTYIGSNETGTAAAARVVGTTVATEPGRRRIIWGAVFAGVIIVLAVQLLLSMLGIGIGFDMVNPGQAGTPAASSFGIGAGVWWVITYLVALFAGGYVAAHLAGRTASPDGALHGLLTWAFTLLVTFYLLSTAIGGVIGGAFNAVGSTLSAAGSGLKDAVPQITQATGVSTSTVGDKAKELLNAQPSNADPKSLSADQAQKEIAAALPTLATGDAQSKQAARDRITAIVAAQANITPEEANARLDKLQSQAAQTKDQVVDTAKQATDKAASGLSTASLLAFAALLLGAGASAFGGHLAARRSDRDAFENRYGRVA